MTASEPTPPSGNEELRHQQMLEVLTKAVFDSDLEFSTQIATRQTSWRPFEIAEYMNVKRRHAEDPTEIQRWGAALIEFLKQIEPSQFPPGEAESLNAIARSLPLQSIASGKELDDVDDKDDAELDFPPDAENWEQDKFAIYLEKGTINRVRVLPIFKEARSFVAGSNAKTPDLHKARSHIQEFVEGELADTMLKVIDYYVYRLAEKYAAGSSDESSDFGSAHVIIDSFSSDDDVATRMKSALDKYVYLAAHKLVMGSSRRSPDIVSAENIVDKYASTLGRRQAMLRRLGYIE